MIGFLGRKRSGKDTAADYIVNKYEYSKKSFGGPLKKGIQEWFQFTDEQLTTELKDQIDPNWGISPRKAFQIIGTDVVRKLFPSLLLPDIGDKFWVKTFNIWYNKNYDQHLGKVVLSDVRFQNEVDFIKKNGGIVIKLTRPCLNNKDNHTSESLIDLITNYDEEIVNDSNLQDFYDQIDSVIYK